MYLNINTELSKRPLFKIKYLLLKSACLFGNSSKLHIWHKFNTILKLCSVDYKMSLIKTRIYSCLALYWSCNNTELESCAWLRDSRDLLPTAVSGYKQETFGAAVNIRQSNVANCQIFSCNFQTIKGKHFGSSSWSPCFVPEVRFLSALRTLKFYDHIASRPSF